MSDNHIGRREIAVDNVGPVHLSNLDAYHAHYAV